jgi:hypothetical protein
MQGKEKSLWLVFCSLALFVLVIFAVYHGETGQNGENVYAQKAGGEANAAKAKMDKSARILRQIDMLLNKSSLTFQLRTKDATFDGIASKDRVQLRAPDLFIEQHGATISVNGKSVDPAGGGMLSPFEHLQWMRTYQHEFSENGIWHVSDKALSFALNRVIAREFAFSDEHVQKLADVRVTYRCFYDEINDRLNGFSVSIQSKSTGRLLDELRYEFR